MRHEGAVVAGCPAYERKDAICVKRDDAMLSIDYVHHDDAAEADPVLDTLLEPCQLDMSELAHVTSPASSELDVVPPIKRRRCVLMSGAGSLGRAHEVHLG